MADLITVGTDSITEFTEKKSIFIGQAFYVSTPEEAETYIGLVREEHPEATHVCFAYSLRNGSLQRFSDDGEPSGTAGMPILHVINAQKLVDTLITVTRYFGGILLGAGGLVRAYSRSAADAVEAAGKATISPFTSFTLEYGYDLHNQIERILASWDAVVTDKAFTDKVTVSAILPKEKFSSLKDEIGGVYHKFVVITECGETENRVVIPKNM